MTSTMLAGLAFGLAVVAAARSTWSPCGISMLSTLTPLGERSRGHRYPVTVSWFVLGATFGGASLGAVMAGLAYGAGRLSLSGQGVAVAVVAAAAVTIASDLRLGGFHLPTVPRQVNENWTGRYRHWVYATGFGWQIGTGVTTYVMTAAVYLLVVLAALTGTPLVALAVGTTFGLVRGLAILLGIRLSAPEAIRAFHARFEAAAHASLGVALSAQANVLALALARAVDAPLTLALALVDGPLVLAFALVRWSPWPRSLGRHAP